MDDVKDSGGGDSGRVCLAECLLLAVTPLMDDGVCAGVGSGSGLRQRVGPAR